MDDEVKEVIQAIGDGRLVFLPFNGTYRAGEGGREVTVRLASRLLRLNYIEPADARPGVYKLTASGKDALKEIEESDGPQ